ncbi:MarR family transcriptional regulator [Geomonas silvestris]|uniref:MarR family transcriptional regulator n=1 Tax=Geomonas silvestris TaxID=2740184 RepID=A0A6V8MIB7_9BACT|nr:MarR family winged helix-turn-helix transcriptional regulator [Geomonas silvestris]GFO59755.1 MarR family transcriptional regulator [Geomonas silvestris]
MKIPNQNPSICSCVNLRRASRAITRIYDKALEPVDLKITQYSVLANVARSGPLSSSNLARILRLDRTTLVRNLKSLEAAGFIEEHPEVTDPRERAIRITEAGRQMVEKARPLWVQAQQQVEDHLGSAALQQLTTLVTSLETLSDHIA